MALTISWIRLNKRWLTKYTSFRHQPHLITRVWTSGLFSPTSAFLSLFFSLSSKYWLVLYFMSRFAIHNLKIKSENRKAVIFWIEWMGSEHAENKIKQFYLLFEECRGKKGNPSTEDMPDKYRLILFLFLFYFLFNNVIQSKFNWLI